LAQATALPCIGLSSVLHSRTMDLQGDCVLMLLAKLHHEALIVLSEAVGKPIKGLQQGGRLLRLPSVWQRKLREIDTCAAWSRHTLSPKVSSVIDELKKVVAVSLQNTNLGAASDDCLPVHGPAPHPLAAAHVHVPDHFDQHVHAPHEQVHTSSQDLVGSAADIQKKIQETTQELTNLQSSLQESRADLAKAASMLACAEKAAAAAAADTDVLPPDVTLGVVQRPQNVCEFLWLLHRVLVLNGPGLQVVDIPDRYGCATGFKFNIECFLVCKNGNITDTLKRVPHIIDIIMDTKTKSAFARPKLPKDTSFQQWLEIDVQYRNKLKKKNEQVRSEG